MKYETKLIRFDWAIKTVLRDKANFDILEGFLSALLGEEIFIVELLENKSKQSEFANKNRMNLLVKDSQQRHFIIEIQAQQVAGYLERQLIGVSNAIVENLELGRSYRDVKKVISVTILYFNIGLDEDYLYHGSTCFKGLHTHNSLKFRMVVNGNWLERNIFPEYYLINVESFEDVIASNLDEWIYLLKHSNTRPEFKARHIEKVPAKLALSCMSSEERRRYERFLMDVATDRDVFETARRLGREEGRQEVRQLRVMAIKLEFAQKLRNEGMDVETIAEMTGLAREVVDSLKVAD